MFYFIFSVYLYVILRILYEYYYVKFYSFFFNMKFPFLLHILSLMLIKLLNVIATFYYRTKHFCLAVFLNIVIMILNILKTAGKYSL